ncbi:26S proteasome regulatory subunit RPN9 [Hanseniaspora osmophila]|uniref:26S proteasome regulatory subunit RPN9 n=1 Tax=Hanseniaspora osmophila TaxID=56408 RepID=A0A1E5R015_9ASCO|nr:26S proteasome regulatory subunit RPN9 [Hanseniaspora osmophila]
MDTVLTTLRMEVEDPELSVLFYEFEEYYEQKLWHQLTQSLVTFFQSATVPDAIKLSLYTQFVTTFIDKINQLSCVDFLLCSIANSDSYTDSLDFLNDLKKKFEAIDSKKTNLNDGFKNHSNGILLISLEISRIYLKQGKLLEASDALDNFKETLDNDQQDIISLRVKSSYYSTLMDYYEIKKDFNSYYYNGLLYLSASGLGSSSAIATDGVSSKFLKDLPYNMSLAALLGDKIYNFGELLQHPIMQLLGPENQWLLEYLNALTMGDFAKFDSISQKYVPTIDLLSTNESFLKQKICLMTLVEIVFSKNVRTLSFLEIAQATNLAEDNVEHLVMKSISLGLLKGTIDQVNALVIITWVQPRVMNDQQILKMQNRLVQWNENVSTLGAKIEEQGKVIWV